MRLVRKAYLLLLTCVALLAASNVNAASNWQLSMGVGSVSASDNVDNVNADIDDRDISLTIGIGYQFNEQLTLRAGYVDLGKAKAQFDIQTTETNLPALLQQALGEVPVMGEGVEFGLSYTFFQQENWRVDANVGMFFWESEINTTAQGLTLTRKDDGSDFTYGLTGLYDLRSDLSAYLKLQRYELAPNNVDEVQLGIIYRF